MLSDEELIYHFTDIYLKTAMECSICKENYLMADDNKFLDEFMKLFTSLLLASRNDSNLEIPQLIENLNVRREETLSRHWQFMKRQITEQAVEYADCRNREYSSYTLDSNNCYIQMIEQYMKYVFDSESENLKNEPVRLLKHIREKEEEFKKTEF